MSTASGTVILDLDAKILDRLRQLIGPIAQSIIPQTQSLLQRADSIVYDPPSTSQRTPAEIDRVTFENNTSLQDSKTVTVNKTIQLTHQWTVTHGISVGAKLGFNIAGVNGDVSTTLSFTETEMKSEQVGRSINAAFMVGVKPHTRVVTMILLDEVNFAAHFRGNMRLMGVLPFQFYTMTLAGSGSIPIGELFSRYPDPEVTVDSSTSISCVVEGDYLGVQGNDVFVRSDETSLETPPDASSSQTTELLRFRL